MFRWRYTRITTQVTTHTKETLESKDGPGQDESVRKHGEVVETVVPTSFLRTFHFGVWSPLRLFRRKKLIYLNVTLCVIVTVLCFNYYKLYFLKVRSSSHLARRSNTETPNVRNIFPEPEPVQLFNKSSSNIVQTNQGLIVVDHATLIPDTVDKTAHAIKNDRPLLRVAVPSNQKLKLKSSNGGPLTLDIEDADELDFVHRAEHANAKDTTDPYHERLRLQVVESTPKVRKAIILIAFHRSGSSFTGELLNIHPDVYYSYEPLKLVHDGCSVEKEERLKLLKRLIDCDIPDLRKHPEQFILNKQINSYGWNATISGNYVFRTKSSRLCRGEFCNNKDFSVDGTACRYRCPPVNVTLAGEVCRKHSVGIKLIRLCEMDLVRELILSMPHIDFKIVLLNRDPRGILNSRMKIFDTKIDQAPLINNVKWTCNFMLQRYKSVRFDTPWLSKFVKIARYEKIAQHPLFASRDFYNFTGLLLNWHERKHLEDTVIGISRKYHHKKGDELTYDTAKNSKRIWQQWRQSLNFSMVESIQKVCGETMRALGYLPVNNENDLRDNEISLVRDLDVDEL